MSDRDLILLLVAVVGALISAVAFLVWRAVERGENRSDIRDSRDEGRERRLGDKQSTHGETLASISARLDRLQDEAAKCDELDRDVAVLKDFKQRAEAKFDEVDETSRELRGMAEQMKTAFHRMEDLPEQITSRVLAQIPKAVLDTLAAARALNQSGKAA